MALTRIPDGASIEIGVTIGGKVALGTVAFESTFGTGSRGYQVPGKVVINGKPYQCNVQMVEIGSKPAAATNKGK